MACSGEPEGEALDVETTMQSIEATTFPATGARQWMQNLALSVKFDGVTPPVAARTYTYGAIALYESVVHGMPGYQSLAGQLNGLEELPVPDPDLEYDWPTVLAQTMDTFINSGVYVHPNRLFYEYTTPVQAALTSLGPIQIGFRRGAGIPEEVIEDSINFGSDLGNALAAWADEDGYYDTRYASWVPPTGPDKWVPTGFQDTDKVSNPLEPHFGNLRPLVMETPEECAAIAPVAFSTTPGSDMHNEAMDVYNTEVNLTDEQREIANFWADGPGATPTPAGHWLAIATKFLRSRNLGAAAAGYAFTSLGYYDAFVAVWNDKYKYNLLRPETYIRRHIDPAWRGHLNTPQFPSYTSGHTGQSAAAATLFTEWFGDVAFVDDTKLRRGFGPHSYGSFLEAADEASVSRVYGGIHYPMDTNPDQGLCVGNLVKTRVSMTL